MLARIQTLYLVIAALLACSSSFLPFWHFTAEESIVLSDFAPFAEAGLIHTTTLYLSSILSPLSVLLSIAAIFFYSNRRLQSTMIIALILLFLLDLLSGLAAAHFMNEWLQNTSSSTLEHAPGAGFFVLIPEPLLFWLAMKGIQKDEKIATAYKRL